MTDRDDLPHIEITRKGFILHDAELVLADGTRHKLPITGVTYSHEHGAPGNVALAFTSDLVRFLDA